MRVSMPEPDWRKCRYGKMNKGKLLPNIPRCDPYLPVRIRDVESGYR